MAQMRYAIPFQPKTFRDFYAFEEHVKTCRGKRGLELNPDWYEIPVFYFSNPYAMCAHQTEVYAPAASVELDFELELGLVIGKAGRNISAARAWDHVAGFCIINDFSSRDLQRKEMSLQLGPAKGKDFATGMGPYFVSKDQLESFITERGTLRLGMSAYLNGKKISVGNAETMYYSWPQIIEHASRDVDLQAGDLLGSGTVGTGCILELGTEAVGSYLRPGDHIRLEIDELGCLENPITERPL
jgi:fumarylacetoacetate (FAA) hydrolase